MAWYWIALIVIFGIAVVVIIVGNIIIYISAEIGSVFFKGRKGKRKGAVPKGHGLPLEWWHIPVIMLVYPFAVISEWFRRKSRKGDPHDISGEPDIPGGNRP